MSSLLNIIKEKLGEHNPEEVTKKIFISSTYIYIQIEELILDNLITTDKLTEDHKNSIENYSTLYRLSLNNIGLTSLENFPKLKELQIVSLYTKNNIFNIIIA